MAEPFSKWGGAEVHIKTTRENLWFELATVTSQALKYDVFTCTPFVGPNYNILEKIKPL